MVKLTKRNVNKKNTKSVKRRNRKSIKKRTRKSVKRRNKKAGTPGSVLTPLSTVENYQKPNQTPKLRRFVSYATGMYTVSGGIKKLLKELDAGNIQKFKDEWKKTYTNYVNTNNKILDYRDRDEIDISKETKYLIIKLMADERYKDNNEILERLRLIDNITHYEFDVPDIEKNLDFIKVDGSFLYQIQIDEFSTGYGEGHIKKPPDDYSLESGCINDIGFYSENGKYLGKYVKHDYVGHINYFTFKGNNGKRQRIEVSRDKTYTEEPKYSFFYFKKNKYLEDEDEEKIVKVYNAWNDFYSKVENIPHNTKTSNENEKVKQYIAEYGNRHKFYQGGLKGVYYTLRKNGWKLEETKENKLYKNVYVKKNDEGQYKEPPTRVVESYENVEDSLETWARRDYRQYL